MFPPPTIEEIKQFCPKDSDKKRAIDVAISVWNYEMKETLSELDQDKFKVFIRFVGCRVFNLPKLNMFRVLLLFLLGCSPNLRKLCRILT